MIFLIHHRALLQVDSSHSNQIGWYCIQPQKLGNRRGQKRAIKKLILVKIKRSISDRRYIYTRSKQKQWPINNLHVEYTVLFPPKAWILNNEKSLTFLSNCMALHFLDNFEFLCYTIEIIKFDTQAKFSLSFDSLSPRSFTCRKVLYESVESASSNFAFLKDSISNWFWIFLRNFFSFLNLLRYISEMGKVEN